MNNEGQPAAPDLPSFLPAHLKVINEGGVTPSFIHHGEKVTAFPDAVAAPNSNTEDIEYEAALESYEAFNPLSAAMVKGSTNGDFGVPANSIQQAKSGDIGLSKIIAATFECQANISSRASIIGENSPCMARTQQALGFNTDPTSIVSHEYDVESGNCFKRHVITAVVNGTEHNIDPSDANNWHTPKNEREYLRSPQRAEWRTAKEKKMDQYAEL